MAARIRVKSAESLHGSAQENHIFIDDKWYGYGRGDALHDAIAGRVLPLPDRRRRRILFYQRQANHLVQRSRPGFEAEKLDDEYHNYPTARVAENFEHKIDDHARVWENVEVIPPLTDPEAFLVNAEVGVETPLTHKLSLQTYLQDNFANEPASGYKDNDLKARQRPGA